MFMWGSARERLIGMYGSHERRKWEMVEERVVFRNQFVCVRNDLVRRPDDKIVEYAVIENRSYSATVCMDSQNRLVMVNQFRYPWSQFSWEFPSGLLEPGEEAVDCAAREIQEETGYKVEEIQRMYEYYPTGLGSGLAHMFFARVKERGKQMLDAGESIEVGVFSPVEVEQMITDGLVFHGSTLLGWLMARSLGLI
jgi:8-oxo-dGTP pyrophosphatase MutT (NUDIX family)